jgi:hypothetical protein
MRQSRNAGWIAFLALAIGSVVQAQSDMSSAEIQLRRQAEALKPSAAELRFQQIPWELDLTEAIRAAKKEQRPIFLWAAGGRDRDGEPLERC